MSNESADATSLALIEEQADARIRRVWVDDRWYFSVIDIVGFLTESARPRKYWNDLKTKLISEGYTEVSEKIGQLKMLAADGKMRATDAADLRTLLRIIQSIPSPKAEPVKRWLAKVGAERVEAATQPLPPADAGTQIATLTRPAEDAPALAWAHYHEQLAALYRRQAAYETRLAVVESNIDELHDRMESVEEVSRLLPEILERLGPQTLTPEHQGTLKAMVKRLHEVSGLAYPTINYDLAQAFHVGKTEQLPEARWGEIVTWLQTRITAAERRRH
ncbi:MAG TPA: Bro-N domain-containing protein [Ktedonobacterales bacterium]